MDHSGRRGHCATGQPGRAVDVHGNRCQRSRRRGRADDGHCGRPASPPPPAQSTSAESTGCRRQVRGHEATAAVRTGASARTVPPVAQPVAVVAAARAIHDHAVKSAQPARVHQRGRRQARDPVADARTVAAHAVGPVARLQHARGDRRPV